MPRHIVQVRFNIPQGFRNINNNNNVNADARYIFGRNQLYRIAFMRFTLIYARVFGETFRRIFEFVLLIAALFTFICLIYIHVVFVHLPVTCLEGYQKEWDSSKILRVELLRKNGNSNYSLYDSYYKEHAMRLLDAGLKPCPRVQYFQNDQDNVTIETNSEDHVYKEESLEIADLLKCRLNETNEEKGFLEIIAEEINAAFYAVQPKEEFNIIEYSLEYGFLRLSPAMRKSLNLSVLFVALDPTEDKCFGGMFHTFILDEFLGYDELLISSVRHLAENSNFKGYVRNVGKETEYIFVNDNGWLHSYLVAAIIMPVTTFSVALLLRFAHQQMFVACTNMFDFLRFQGQRRYNGSPLFTVILALFGMMAIITFNFVGMMAIITSFFHNSTLTLNITFIIWIADFYDSICCRALISKRHWYRFFLLYHYAFYAYNHRFNGLHWQLNLLASWLFILHSMVFFFHHYELPYYVQSFVQFREAHIIRPPRFQPPVQSPPSDAGQSTEPAVPQPDEHLIDNEAVNAENHIILNSDSFTDVSNQDTPDDTPASVEPTDDSSGVIQSDEQILKCEDMSDATSDESCSKGTTENVCANNCKCKQKCGASAAGGAASPLIQPSHSDLPNVIENEQRNSDSEQILNKCHNIESNVQCETDKLCCSPSVSTTATADNATFKENHTELS